MIVEKVVCDECQRVKDTANHWHQMGVQVTPDSVWIEMGTKLQSPDDNLDDYSVHDLCGEQCFYRHLGKLLKINPVKAPEDEAAL